MKTPRFSRPGFTAMLMLVTAAVPAQTRDAPDLDRAFEYREFDAVRTWVGQFDETVGQHADVLRARALLARYAEQHDRALELIGRAIEQAPERADLRVDRTEIRKAALEQAGLFESLKLARAIHADLERAVELDPENVRALRALRAFHQRAPGLAGGSRERAAAISARLAKIAPEWLDWEEAAELADDRQWNAALITLDRAMSRVEVPPLEWRLLRVRILQALERFDAARAAARRLVRDAPGYAPGWYQLGRLSTLTGRGIGRGTDALEKFLDMPRLPGDPPPQRAWWRLGLLHEQAGRYADARLAFRQALEIDPDFDEAVAALERLGAPFDGDADRSGP